MKKLLSLLKKLFTTGMGRGIPEPIDDGDEILIFVEYG